MFPTAETCGAIFSIILSIVGLAGNLMTVIVLLRNPSIRQHSTTAFILSLSISDLIFSSFCLPFVATSFLKSDFMGGGTLCKLFGSAHYIFFATTTFSITAIAINRYILIVHNELYKRAYQSSIVLCQLLMIWLVPIALMQIPLYDMWGTISEFRGLCKVNKINGETIEDFLFVIGIMSPCIIISVLYACIYYRVRQHLKNVSSHISSKSSAAKERHLTMMTLLIFISFVVCCLPLVVEHLWFLESSSPWPHILAATFCGLLTVINPFIYAASNRKYRTAYHKLFSDLKCCHFGV